MAQTSRTGDLTSGPMLKKIILFSLPLAASSILQLLFNAADVVVVGRFAGSTALAAVGSNGALINLLVNLFVGLSLGANVVAARCFGARDEKGVQNTAQSRQLRMTRSRLSYRRAPTFWLVKVTAACAKAFMPV